MGMKWEGRVGGGQEICPVARGRRTQLTTTTGEESGSTFKVGKSLGTKHATTESACPCTHSTNHFK